jgi:hypothetical protein
MKIVLTLLAFIFFCIVSSIETKAQTRWVEQRVTMGSGESNLSEAWLEDAQKNIIERRKVNFDAKTREDWMTSAKTAYNGKKITKTEMYSKEIKNGVKLSMTIVFDYDNNNRKTKSSIYFHAGTKSNDPVMFTTYIYDSNANLISETTTSTMDYLGNPTDPQVSIIEYRYQDSLLIEEWKVAEDSATVEHYSYKYDVKGNMIEKKLLDEIDYLEKQLYTFSYDNYNRIIEDTTFLNNGKIFRRHKFIYNEAGDLIKQFEYGDETDNPLVTVTYKYEEVSEKEKSGR